MHRLKQRLSRLRAAWSDDQTGWTDPERVAWAELALRISFDKIEAQRNEAIRIRSQSTLFVTFIGAAISFLVGAVMHPDIERTTLFYTLATIGTMLIGAFAVLLVLILAPILKFNFSLNAQKLLGWTAGASDYLNAVESLVTTTLPKDLQHNRTGLIKLRWLFVGLIVTGVCSLAMWIWILWACA